ncbi:hypothetical protein [Micromonospora inositola]|nr:hypothetical protein [Micromonospora inositola]
MHGSIAGEGEQMRRCAVFEEPRYLDTVNGQCQFVDTVSGAPTAVSRL